jgi:hypothetical protein
MFTRDKNYQNTFGIQPITNLSIFKKLNNISTSCNYKGFYPNFTPIIYSLSLSSSIAKTYSQIFINGNNFLPPCYGTTYINFGSFKNLPIIFYSSSDISFIVPFNANSGNYNINVVNIYNSNFSPAINQSYPGNQNFSNTITYTII